VCKLLLTQNIWTDIFMGTLLEDIKVQSSFIIKAFSADDLKLDYTVHSFIEVDKFFNRNVDNGRPVKGGRLTKNLGPIIFSIGSYVGETIVKTIPGAVWQTDDNDPQGEINASVRLPDGTIMWPMQRVMKRFQNGSEDSIYVYGHSVTKELTNELFDQSYWQIDKEKAKPNKPWWKFW
jgi:hypothetical protein